MKRTLYLATIFFLLLAAVSPAAASPADSPQNAPDLPDVDNFIFLPMTVRFSSYTVSGRITYDVSNMVSASSTTPSQTENPLRGITIRDSMGRTTVTDSMGRYTMTVREGSRITPQHNDFYFYPSYQVVNGPMDNLNFSGSAPRISLAATTRPEAQVLPNPGFEVDPYYWNPISGNAAGYTPDYSTAAFHTGTRSGFTGIPLGWTTYQQSWSRWRSHEVLIPVGATQADVTLWIRPGTEAFVAAADGDAPAELTSSPEIASEFEKIYGWDTEDANLPDLAVEDFYYVSVIRPDNTVIRELTAIARTNAGWTAIGPFSLLAEAGQWVKLEFGTYNNTDLLDSYAYFDDIALEIDTAAVTCSNILLNSDFELDSDWLYKAPQNVPPKYSLDFFFSPLRSMQTGIAPWEAEPPYETTTEFFQPFTIPAEATYAQLRMVVLPKSTNWWGWWAAQEQINLQPLSMADIGAPYSTMAPTQTESQYAFISDSAGINGEWLLFKYFSIDSSNWLARSYNLTPLAGTGEWAVLFGTGDIYPWKTSLFVDEVYLDVCTP